MKTIKKGSRGAEVKALQQKLHLMADGIFGKLTDEAVREFQKKNNLTADGIVGPKTWEALGVKAESKRYVNEIIIHYTATPRDEDFSVEQIRQSHLARKFADIGYHFVIYRDGSVHKGRSEAIAGAHCTNHNGHSIGVCYVGGCPSRKERKDWMTVGLDTRTLEQKTSILKLLKELKKRYPDATVHGHREFANKPCPGFDAKAEYKNI